MSKTVEFIVKDSVEIIGSYAFANSNISSIIINNKVSVYEQAFANMEKLESIYILDGYTRLEDNCFMGTTNCTLYTVGLTGQFWFDINIDYGNVVWGYKK